MDRRQLLELRAGLIDSFKTEKRYLRKDGTPVWVGLTIAVKRDRNGQSEYDISIVSKSSTIRSGTKPGMSCCARWARGFGNACARATSSPG